MVRRRLVASREEAQEAIGAGLVTVGGAMAEKASRMVSPEEPVELLAPPRRFVGRGGEKLSHALTAFGTDPTRLRCLDVGASTGGFTDCLLQAGASVVYAVDVGHGQLAQKIREDGRVVVHEGLHARDIGLETVGGRTVDLATVDVSFISLRRVIPAVASVVHHDGPIIALVKPQFEATRNQVGKGGIVTDPEVWTNVLGSVAGACSAQNVYMVAVEPSPITGAEGNVEFLTLLRKNDPAGRIASSDIADAVAKAQALRASR